MTSRREFIKTSAAIGAGLIVGARWQPVWAYSYSQSLPKFVQPLRDVTVGGGIPLAGSDGVVNYATGAATHYSISIEQFEDQLHPSLPNPTRLWGYRASNIAAGANRHLGSIIAAKRGTPVQITATNNLPAAHILPVDATIMGAELGQASNMATIHLHGGFVPWLSDGGPHSWFDPAGNYGASMADGEIYKAVNPGLADGQGEYYYPNDQGARLLWYHDHALGITRLNAYAGIASAYVIYDDYELALGGSPWNLPGPLDPRTKYLVFQDKIFVDTAEAMDVKDPTWYGVMPDSRPGDLWYAHVYEPALWPLAPGGLPLPDVSCVPEFFGDTILVNGTVSPYLEVEQRQYRFRLLNACGARFLNPRLVYARGKNGVATTEPSASEAGPAFVQIGTEGGFLPAPVMLNGPKQPQLLLGPAERADLIVDFRNVRAGALLILYNDAPAPYPMGGADNDYYPQNPKTPSSIPGSSPNTRTLLQIRVKARAGAADEPISMPATNLQNPGDPFIVVQTPGVPTAIPADVPIRRLTLNEEVDAYGRLIQMLGTDVPVVPGSKGIMPGFGRAYDSTATENVATGTTEVWEILNLTGDTHPMHFHLVNVQVLSRQAFGVSQYVGGAPSYQGPLLAPDANELGWKETVRMNPGQATRVIAKFDVPAAASLPFAVPPSPRTGGNEYVWHCHILEHEEHDMMRALVVA